MNASSCWPCGSSMPWVCFGTQAARRSPRSTGRASQPSAGRLSPSTSSTPTGVSSTSATSTASRDAITSFTISRETLVGGEFGDGMTLDDYIRAIGLPSGGAVRASLGLASNLADIISFDVFSREFVDLTAVPDDLPRRVGC